MSNIDILHLGVVGCGAVSELYYTPAINQLEKRNKLRVKALFDPNPERVAKIHQSFPHAHHVKDFNELSNMNIDLVIVASPPKFHAEQTISLLKSGHSVLCEKPMATTVTEGEAMIEAASSCRRILAIGLYRRFLPATQFIRNVLSHGLLGEVKTFYCYEGGRFSWPIQSFSFFKKETARGGVLLDLGVHLLDLLIWWWGEPVEVRCEDDAMGGLETNSYLTLKFAEGFFGKVRLSWDWSRPSRYIIKCTKGWLCWNVNEADQIEMGFYNTDFSQNVKLHANRCEGGNPTLGPKRFNFEQSFVSQLDNVVASIHGTEQLVVSGEQGLSSLKLIENCYNHRQLMAMPWISEKEVQGAQSFRTGS